MAELTDVQIDAALERGRPERLHEPRAVSARYDRQLDRIVVELTNGCTFAFPPRLGQALHAATKVQLTQIEILDANYGLDWKELDADLSIPGLLSGLFGPRAFAAQHAGRSRSPAKARAARANGAKGGRPRKKA